MLCISSFFFFVNRKFDNKKNTFNGTATYSNYLKNYINFIRRKKSVFDVINNNKKYNSMLQRLTLS
jgi:hypothetical protein